MKRFLLILILLNFANSVTQGQSFNIDDLISMAYLPAGNINHFMNRKGFAYASTNANSKWVVASFVWKFYPKRKDTLTKKSIDLIKKGSTRYISFHTSSLEEFQDGEKRLIKDDFFYDDKLDMSKEDSVLFQKRNISVEAITEKKDGVTGYTFLLQQKEIPDVNNIRYAEDLLRFDSHEYLVSFFGEQNVKKDLYYFSEKELKKCSVLFGGTSRQVVFVWNDENNLDKLAYILVSNIMPTEGAVKFNGVVGNNEWKLQNGIYAGMSIEELIKLNQNDFGIYGNKSELSFMIKPAENGRIDFRKTAVLLSCNNCNNDNLFNRQEVRAIDVERENLPMYVFDIILYPTSLKQ